MALNIKNPQVERLAADVAALTGESKTKAIRKALEERKNRLSLGGAQSQRERWLEFFGARSLADYSTRTARTHAYPRGRVVSTCFTSRRLAQCRSRVNGLKIPS